MTSKDERLGAVLLPEKGDVVLFNSLDGAPIVGTIINLARGLLYIATGSGPAYVRKEGEVSVIARWCGWILSQKPKK